MQRKKYLLHETGRLINTTLNTIQPTFNESLLHAKFCELRKNTICKIHKLTGSSSWLEQEETTYKYCDSRNENLHRLHRL